MSNFALPIDSTAPVVYTESIDIRATKEKVWDTLTTINQWHTWNKLVSNCTVHGDIVAGTSFTWKSGGASINSTLHTVAPFMAFGWSGKSMGVYAIHNWRISESNGITTLVVEESMSGFLAWLLSSMLTKQIKTGSHEWLLSIKRVCEGA